MRFEILLSVRNYTPQSSSATETALRYQLGTRFDNRQHGSLTSRLANHDQRFALNTCASISATESK